MKRRALYLSAALAVACHSKSSATLPDASTHEASAAGVAVDAPAALIPRPDLRERRLTSLSIRASSIVDVAPARSSDAEHPLGTVYVAAVLGNGRGRGEATLFEWDVASASALEADGRILYRESDKEDNGRSADVRIATSPARDGASTANVFAAVTLEHGRFTVFGRVPLDRPNANPEGEDLPPMVNVSLETDGQWLAMAYERPPYVAPDPRFPHYGVLLYDVATMKRVATASFGHSTEAKGRHDVLELVDGRLYAAEAYARELCVTELAVPSLKVVRTRVVSVPDGTNRVELTRTRGHVAALANHVLVELTADLDVIGKSDVASDEVALGPAGEILTTVGLDAPGKRGDFVPDARVSASCTPAWAGHYPLLGCAVDMDGIRLVRLSPR